MTNSVQILLYDSAIIHQTLNNDLFLNTNKIVLLTIRRI